MMIRKIWRAGCLATLMFLASCGTKTEYTHALPKNASMVTAMEVDAMARKAGLNGKEGEGIAKRLKALLKDGLQHDAAQLAGRLVDDPSESGLSLDDKVYLFTTPHAEALALLAKVEEEGKVQKLLEALVKENIATPLKEESGCQWTKIGKVICAFNDGTFLLLQPSKGDAMSMKSTLLSLMRQQEGEGFSSLPEFGKVQAKGNDIASVVNGNAVPRSLTTTLRMGLSANIALEDIKYLVTGNFEEGRVVIRSESLVQNQRIAEFFDNMDGVMRSIQGKYLDAYQGNTTFWMGGNVKGKELYDMLRRNPSIRQQLDNPPLPVDVASIFAAIDGDVAIGINSLYNGDLMLYADVTQSHFLKTFEDLRPLLALTGGQITLDTVGKDEYLMCTYYGNFWFGVKNNRLYVTTNRAWAEEAFRTFGASMGVKPWAGEVKDNRLYASLRLSGKDVMHVLVNQLLGGQKASTFAKPVLNGVECLNISMTDWRHGQAELLLKDKKANLLKLMVDMFGGM